MAHRSVGHDCVGLMKPRHPLRLHRKGECDDGVAFRQKQTQLCTAKGTVFADRAAIAAMDQPVAVAGLAAARAAASIV